ncbi:DUF58 domain-containing protein [Pimelobacter sp. 30-1]|uniref:DUF58 domain-containing protein n=1 Tax=Pimelobacter sp. 30-1 TaxID=2004991 RepID=UPI001C03E7FD|nr:DUF58 domain-containing protein [Pimelobacter sp. 30-1]MBU2695985.1 DUF58 domain-containing protein [Pimelobacter sp. 30-1]
MTISGRVPLLLLLGVAAVVLRPSGGTVLLWLLGVLLLAGLDLLLTPGPTSIGLTRRPPGTVRLGDPATSVLVVANTGARRVHLQVRDAWQPSAGAGTNRFRLHLPAGDQRRLTTPLLPRRRGDLRAAGVTVRSWGPLGLTARQRTFDVPGAVRALPPFDSRKHLPSRLARLRELDGRAAVRVRGQGTEFDSLREYVRGDDVRSIDWRASARSPHVVVRTWQPERDRRVVLVLDTSRTSAGRVARVVGEAETDGMPRLDAAMDAALLLGALASRAGDRIDFAAGDRRVRARQRLHGVRDVAARLQEQMADLDPTLVEADWDLLAGAVQGFGRQRALVVLLTALEPSAIADGLLPVLPALTRHHRVVVASVRDPELTRLAEAADDPALAPTADTVYDAAAAAQELHRRDRMRAVLQRLGVDVVDADAESLPPALADHYLALKAQGLL